MQFFSTSHRYISISNDSLLTDENFKMKSFPNRTDRKFANCLPDKSRFHCDKYNYDFFHKNARAC